VKNFEILFSYGASGQAIGIQLTDTSNVLVANNTISGFESVEAWNGGSYTGIDVEGGASNIITGNNLTYNLYGISFANSAHNQVIGNNIVGDVNFKDLYSTGIYFAGASNNTIYHNNILNSTTQAEVSDSVNVWDDGYPNGGNYWGDYWTKNPNADGSAKSGIANIPCVIDSQNKDRYPLVKPFNATLYSLETIPPKITVQSPIDKKYNESNVPLIFAVDKAVDWIGYSVDEKQNVTIMGNSTIANMTNGLHNLVIYVNDTFGDIGMSQTVSFTVAKPEPFPTAADAVIGTAIVIVAAAVLLVYSRKHRQVKIG
jgi:parallel beta-helix repeat protein